MTAKTIISKLKKLGRKNVIDIKQNKFGIIAKNSLGVYHKDLDLIAKKIGKNSLLAHELFNSDIYEARILCSKIYSPKDLTLPQMQKWAKTFENWEICDSFSMKLFAKSPLAVAAALKWSSKKQEFEKRAAFTIMAAYCMADKTAANKSYEQFFPHIKAAATDERLYVKKSVSWALRNIGKRNAHLQKKSIQLAKELLKFESASALWIAKDVLRELESKNVKMLNYPRAIYG